MKKPKEKTTVKGQYVIAKESCTTIIENDKLVAIIYKDQATRKTIMFSCKEMQEDDIAELFANLGKYPFIPTPFSTRLSTGYIETVDDDLPDGV